MVRPYSGLSAAVRLAVTGIDNIDEINDAVAVVVVGRKINARIIRQLAGLLDHLRSIRIIIAAVVRNCITQLQRTDEVENRVVLTVTLVLEILAGAAFGTVAVRPAGVFVGVVARVVDCIMHAVQSVFGGHERLVREINQDNQAARSRIRFVADARSLLSDAANLLQFLLAPLHTTFFLGITQRNQTLLV